jgi:hypothetical protein
MPKWYAASSEWYGFISERVEEIKALEEVRKDHPGVARNLREIQRADLQLALALFLEGQWWKAVVALKWAAVLTFCDFMCFVHNVLARFWAWRAERRSRS